MARPITWQDVAAPNMAGTIYAANQATETLTKNLGALGQAPVDLRDKIRQEATDAAAAQILQSQDPMAVAAAAPKGWQFDTRALAETANARGKDLQQAKVADATLESAQLQTQISKQTLQNQADEDLAASRFLPIKDAVFSGKKPEIDMNDPWLKTHGGMKFLDLIAGTEKEGRQWRLDNQRARNEQIQAQAAAEQLRLTLGQRKTDDMLVQWRRTPEGAAARPADLQRKAAEFATVNGVGDAYGAQAAVKFGGAEFAGLATESEMKSTSPQGISYERARDAIVGDIAQIESEKIAAQNQMEIGAAGAQAMEKNSYANTSPPAIDNEIIKNNKDSLPWFFGVNDARDRRAHQADLAREEAVTLADRYGLPRPDPDKPILTPAQEANLVELTLDSFHASDRHTSDTDAAAALRNDYILYNLQGGDKGYAHNVATAAAGYDKLITEQSALLRDVESAAMNKYALPKKAILTYERTPEGQLRKKVEEKAWEFVPRTLGTKPPPPGGATHR